MNTRSFLKSLLAVAIAPWVFVRSRWKRISVGGPVCRNDRFESVQFEGSGIVCRRDADGVLTGDPLTADLSYNPKTGLVEPRFASEYPDWESPC